jgi:hypothetical protein
MGLQGITNGVYLIYMSDGTTIEVVTESDEEAQQLRKTYRTTYTDGIVRPFGLRRLLS